MAAYATTMKERISISAEVPEAYEAMTALDDAIGLDEKLRVLVKLRASLINGCVYCIDLHSKEGLAAHESEERLFGLAAWEESPYFSDRERAALALTDAITLIADGHVPDAVWQLARRHFDSSELARLVWTITVVNGWNRIAISTRLPPAG
jgi:AhpD family alkylhydroperoxidase